MIKEKMTLTELVMPTGLRVSQNYSPSFEVLPIISGSLRGTLRFWGKWVTQDKVQNLLVPHFIRKMRRLIFLYFHHHLSFVGNQIVVLRKKPRSPERHGGPSLQFCGATIASPKNSQPVLHYICYTKSHSALDCNHPSSWFSVEGVKSKAFPYSNFVL